MIENKLNVHDLVVAVKIHQYTDDRVLGKTGRISQVFNYLDMYLIDFGTDLGCWCLGHEYVELAK